MPAYVGLMGLNRHSSRRAGPRRHGHRPEWHKPPAARAG